VDAEGEPEPQTGERSPKRARVQEEQGAEMEVEPSEGGALAANLEEQVSAGTDVAVAVVRSPRVSRIPRPVGNPVASISSSEVET